MTSKVYVVHHTNGGAAEVGAQIYGIFASEESALQAMESALENDYDSSLDENREEDHIHMFISEQTLWS
jgi:hypothetical protein